MAIKTLVDTDSLQVISGKSLNGTINVKAKGAVGDGSTNDTAAIQSAINEAVLARVGTIVFPPGVYNHTALTCAPSGSQTHINFVGLGGTGAFGVKLHYIGAGGTALRVSNNTRYVFENLALVDQGSGSIGLALDSLSSGSNHSNFLYNNVRIDGFDTDLALGTTSNEAVSDGVFINLETSNATTGIRVNGPSNNANFTTILHFIHWAATFNGTSFLYDGQNNGNNTVFKFDSPSIGQNNLEFDLRSPCFVHLYGAYSESAGEAQFMKVGSSNPTQNCAVNTYINIDSSYIAYPSTPSNYVCQFNQPGHYSVRSSVLATGSLILGGFDGGGGRKSSLTVENSTIVSASQRIQYRAGSNTVWLVRHLQSGITAEEVNNCDDDRTYLIKTTGVEHNFGTPIPWASSVSTLDAL